MSLKIPCISRSLIERLGLKETTHFFGYSRKFGIKVYEYKDGILCGMMDSSGGPNDKIIFVRNNMFDVSTKYIEMGLVFLETAPIELIDKILNERLPKVNLIV